MEIAEAVISHLQQMTVNRSEEEKQITNSLTMEKILSEISYYRVHDYVEQIALVNVLPSILHGNPQVTFLN